MVVFLAGFVVMGAELLAGRLMAPAYGSSVTVWGSIIGCLLLTMSAGYWTGGFFADKRPKGMLPAVLVSLAVSVLAMMLFVNMTLPCKPPFSGL